MAVLLLATLGASASAGAASPPRGALVVMHGRGFCLGRGCIALRGFGRAARNAQDSNTIETLLSPDGRFMYVYGGSSPALAVLARDRRTGAVHQLPGRDGCVTSHPVSGCELVRRLAKTFDWALSADGSTLGLLKSPDNPYGRLLFAPNRRTGALRLVGASKHCVAALDGPCQHLRGISFRTGVASSGPHTLLVFGIDGRGGGTLAVLTRPSSGARWRQSTGPAGCFNEHGVAGCTKLPCLSDAPALTATSNDRRHFYVAGGDTDPEDTGVGYLATFVPGARGGLRVVGCSDTGSDKESGFAPAWISTLPHSSTVLVLLVRGNRGDGITWGRMFASTPGAPRSPHRARSPGTWTSTRSERRSASRRTAARCMAPTSGGMAAVSRSSGRRRQRSRRCRGRGFTRTGRRRTATTRSPTAPPTWSRRLTAGLST
jgi:hypothetical protein